MSTLTDFKANLKPGVVADVVNHVYPDLSGRRTIVDVQTKRFSMTLPDGHPRADKGPSWVDIPKAADLTPYSGGFIVNRDADWGDPGPFFTITFYQEAEC